MENSSEDDEWKIIIILLLIYSNYCIFLMSAELTSSHGRPAKFKEYYDGRFQLVQPSSATFIKPTQPRHHQQLSDNSSIGDSSEYRDSSREPQKPDISS